MCRLSWNALEFTALFRWNNIGLFFYIEQDTSLVRFAHSYDILVNTRNKFHISTHPCIILYLCSVIETNFVRFWEISFLLGKHFYDTLIFIVFITAFINSYVLNWVFFRKKMRTRSNFLLLSHVVLLMASGGHSLAWRQLGMT